MAEMEQQLQRCYEAAANPASHADLAFAFQRARRVLGDLPQVLQIQSHSQESPAGNLQRTDGMAATTRKYRVCELFLL